MKKQKRSSKAPKPKRRKHPMLLVVLICAGIVGAGGWIFKNQSGMGVNSKSAISNAEISGKEVVPTVSSDNFQNLVGRWMRPDGGYIIEIRNVDSKGQLQAAYFNPWSINVSQSRLINMDKEMQIFIELKDTGYPGATYALTYHQKQDMLAGFYYQPTVDQSFTVVFVRMNS